MKSEEKKEFKSKKNWFNSMSQFEKLFWATILLSIDVRLVVQIKYLSCTASF